MKPFNLETELSGEKEGWINIYSNGSTDGYIYNSEEEARALGWTDLITCVRIE